MTDLGTLGGLDSSGNAINDLGEVVGTSNTTNNGSSAFADQNTVVTAIGPGDATAVNNSGEMVGAGRAARPRYCTTFRSTSTPARIASITTTIPLTVRIAASPSAARFSARRWPWGWLASAGRPPNRIATKVSTAATTSPLDSIPAEKTEAAHDQPHAQLNTASAPAATTDTSAVRS